MQRLIIVASGLALGAACLAGCDYDSGARAIGRMQAEHDRIDPPVLWSIQVVDEADNGRPVLICANHRIVSGFSSIAPSLGDRDCVRSRDMYETDNGFHYRCKIGDVSYGVSSSRFGDAERDFQVHSSAHALSFGGVDYDRTLRFRRIGACPPDWKLGQATDQHGARTTAFSDQTLGER